MLMCSLCELSTPNTPSLFSSPELLEGMVDLLPIVPHEHVLEGFSKQGQLKGSLILV